ncbi:hypothetical protein BJ508DRAFT_339255 [Ascobolus immersus RN42]|uniref:Rhodanese domain-containing protein n=1 Tax=Ascobolus immersus RN42 TaxID=1160509 RepID=A0A3N4HML6_ASCIM|nr:hypothetical protein BJ508DRAFT_339255 [Ascobolus immersus RN42]
MRPIEARSISVLSFFLCLSSLSVGTLGFPKPSTSVNSNGALSHEVSSVHEFDMKKANFIIDDNPAYRGTTTCLEFMSKTSLPSEAELARNDLPIFAPKSPCRVLRVNPLESDNNHPVHQLVVPSVLEVYGAQVAAPPAHIIMDCRNRKESPEAQMARSFALKLGRLGEKGVMCRDNTGINRDCTVMQWEPASVGSSRFDGSATYCKVPWPVGHFGIGWTCKSMAWALATLEKHCRTRRSDEPFGPDRMEGHATFINGVRGILAFHKNHDCGICNQANQEAHGHNCEQC